MKALLFSFVLDGQPLCEYAENGVFFEHPIVLQ